MLKLSQKLLLLSLVLTLSTLSHGKPGFNAAKRYHIVATQFSGGCVTDGGTANANTPLFYLTEANTSEATYWIIEEQGDGYYTIRNAATEQYITYDGQRSDYATDGITRRYVDMTDDVNGNYSLWTFQQREEGVYTIRNSQVTDHLWDVRVDSYVVGTYSNSGNGNSNQLFSIYDADGTLVTEQAESNDDDGIDVSSWLNATAEALTGWEYTGSWQLPPYSNYTNGNASLTYPFVEIWHNKNNGGLPDSQISQTLTCMPAGQYTLTADINAVYQSGGNGTPASGVVLFAGDNTINASSYDGKPVHFEMPFTLTKTQDLTVGVRLQQTTANWVAFDNLRLLLNTTADQLLESEREKVTAELTDRLGAEKAAETMATAGDTFDELEALRKRIALMPAVDPIGKVAVNLRLNGNVLSYVRSTGTYLCSIPLSNFGTDWQATVNYTPEAGCGNLFIDGEEVASGYAYTFEEVGANKTYTLSIRAADNSVVTYPLTFTSLPVVKIYGSFSNDYSEGYISVKEPDNNSALELLNMKAKWRGGITNSDGKNKRNYHVKLKDADNNKIERKFFGLRKDNSWILESCQVDMSRIRNRTLTDLWNDYSTPPYYIAQEPKALSGSRGNFVELILNDEYRGIYCMTENMDRKQMRLMKYDETTQETHGQLWKSKDWTYATLMGTSPDGGYQPKYSLSATNANSELWDQYEVKYPDFEDYGNQTDWQTLYDAVDFVCHSTDEAFASEVNNYFDLPVVIDYYILMETILATDNHGKNMFFGVYDKQTDKKITFGVWDMDATSGQRWSDQYYHWDGMNPEQDYANYIATQEHGDYNLFKRLRDTNANNFNDRVRLRYRDLRNDQLQTESILNRFRTYLAEFKTAGADQREYAKWNGNSDIAGLSLDFDNEMDFLTDWFTRRMNYLDDTRFDINSLPNKGDINGDGEVNIADAMAVVNYILKKPSATFQQIAADVNIDGDINIADAMAVVNIILKKTAAARADKALDKNPN